MYTTNASPLTRETAGLIKDILKGTMMVRSPPLIMNALFPGRGLLALGGGVTLQFLMKLVWMETSLSEKMYILQMRFLHY